MQHNLGGTKPFQIVGARCFKTTCSYELEFYQEVFSRDACQELVEFRQFCPEYFGHNSEGTIELQNLTHNFQNDCILDVKVGFNLASKRHPPQKHINQARKASISTTGTLGFRFSGMIVTDTDGEVSTKWRKAEGYTIIKDHDVHLHLAKFCSPNQIFQPDVAQYFYEETVKVRNWFARQTSKHFFTTSVVYFYDSANVERRVVKLVDYEYVFDAEGVVDQNYLDGLNSLLRTWEKLLGHN